MKRITPEHVLKAYEQTGLTPKQGGYFDEETLCGCGMGVLFTLAYMTGHDMTLEEVHALWDDTFFEYDISRHFDNIYGAAYRAGFTQGFDQLKEKKNDNFYYPHVIADFNQGFEDGWAAWNAVKHLAKGNDDEKNNS